MGRHQLGHVFLSQAPSSLCAWPNASHMHYRESSGHEGPKLMMRNDAQDNPGTQRLPYAIQANPCGRKLHKHAAHRPLMSFSTVKACQHRRMESFEM